MELTDGTLLGGKVTYRQPASGYRTGIEPVLLAAWVPARAGDAVLEAGTGAGAGLLCLWQRIPAVAGIGMDADADLVAIAQANADANGAALHFRCADVLALPPLPRFHHVFSNPPWYDTAGTQSPNPAKRRAKQAQPGLLKEWVAALAGCLHHRGTLSLALPASGVSAAVEALVSARLGSITILPLWPKAGRPARLMLVRAIRGGKGADSILPGLVLHQSDGTYTPETEAVLRGGQGLAA